MQGMPTEWEQDVADAYVNKRHLVRPNMNAQTAVVSVLVFMSVTGLLAWLAHHVLMFIGIVAYLPSPVQRFSEAYPVLSGIAICGMVAFFEMIFCFKYAVIGAIRLYQHYAPEEVRRRCLFMPTCSEYAILAVRKYGGVIGLCKAYYRLMYLCRGSIYKIHYP